LSPRGRNAFGVVEIDGCVPRVAKAQPWALGRNAFGVVEIDGCVPRVAKAQPWALGATPSALSKIDGCVPRVAKAQPWALGRNAFGVNLNYVLAAIDHFVANCALSTAWCIILSSAFQSFPIIELKGDANRWLLQPLQKLIDVQLQVKRLQFPGCV
jgi:hypothetical protein